MAIDRSKVKIRNMIETDLEKIKGIDRELVSPDRAPSWPLAAEADWWVNRPTLNFVAEIDDEVVGFLLGDIRGAKYGTDLSGCIDMMGVAPKYQGMGVGRGLVEAFSEECMRNEVGVRVVIREGDERLIKFWTSIGFQKGNLVSYER